MNAQLVTIYKPHNCCARRVRLLPVLLTFIWMLFTASPVFADILEISPAGVTALKPTGLLRQHPTGSGYYLRGRIIIQRNSADRPTLKFPGKYFMFEPYKSGNTYGPARQLEWAWLNPAQEIDTLDDLRDMLSNRDKQYGGWEAAFNELIAEIDPDDTIYHFRLKGNRPPQVVNPSIDRREGFFSRDLIGGRSLNRGEIEAYMRQQRAKTPEDPLGYSPIDPLFRNGGWRNTMGFLLAAIARAEKYGEPENGFLEAARKVARFISEDLYPPPEALSGPSRQKAEFILGQVAEARGGLFALAEGVDPNRLSYLLTRPGKFGNSLNDKLLYSMASAPLDDALAVNIFDVAKAAIEVMSGWRTPHNEDTTRGDTAIVSILLRAASGRADLQSMRRQSDFDSAHASPLPTEVQTLEDPVAKLAFDTMVALAAPPRDQGLFALEMTRHLDDPDPALRAVVGETVIKAGIGKAADVARLIDSYWEVGLAAIGALDHGNDGTLPRAVVARNVLKRAGPVIKDPALVTIYQQYLARKIDQYRGTRSLVEKHWLDFLK